MLHHKRNNGTRTPIERDGQLYCYSVANLFLRLLARNYKKTLCPGKK